jgi:phosphoglycolate phosphatase-like HAD superfamily hydrolase
LGRQEFVAVNAPLIVVLDIDGTLVDTNYQHVIAWHRALRDHGYAAQLWEIHRGRVLLGPPRGARSRRGLDHRCGRPADKPHPDLVDVALRKAGSGGPAVMVGDSTWDVKAAAAAGIPTLAVLTGGFAEAELREAGAAEVVKSIGELRKDRSALARIARIV